MDKKLILIICLIIYLIIAFGTEFLYRESLYAFSVEFIGKINQEGFLRYFFLFWSYIFLVSILVLGLAISLIFYPITFFYCKLSSLLFLIFIMCILKSIYTNSRPYWDIYLNNSQQKTLPNPTECEGQFGNPSGHSMLGTYLLSFWGLFADFNFYKNLEEKNKKIIKYLFLILYIICDGLIIFSRVHRQVHSFNQIIFGTILGIGYYILLCHILDLDTITAHDFVEKIRRYKYIIIPLFVILYIISVVLGLVRHNPKEEEYANILKIYCGYIKDEIFGQNTALSSSLIFISIGGYIGLLFLRYKINKYHQDDKDLFYDWNKNGRIKALKIFAFSFILPAILIPCIVFTPMELYALKMIVMNICLFAYGFLSFGLCFYYSCLKVNTKSEPLINSSNEGEVEEELKN